MQPPHLQVQVQNVEVVLGLWMEISVQNQGMPVVKWCGVVVWCCSGVVLWWLPLQFPTVMVTSCNALMKTPGDAIS